MTQTRSPDDVRKSVVDALSNPSEDIARDVLAIAGANPDRIEKAITTATGLVAYDLQAPAKNLGQMAVECCYFTVFQEGLNYSAEGLSATWPTRFPIALAARYAHNPPRIAARAYAGRLGNGDEASGDGWRYRGRGYLQITGRTNYAWTAGLTGHDLVADPDQLLSPLVGVPAAGAYWRERAINPLADSGDIEGVTRAVNGGLNGLAARLVATRAFRALCGA